MAVLVNYAHRDLWVTVFYLTFCSNISGSFTTVHPSFNLSQKKVRIERKPESILWFWDEVHGQFLSSKLHHGSVISRWCRDSHVVSFFYPSALLPDMEELKLFHFFKKLCLVDFACRNQWSQSKTTNPVTICHCRQASATHSTSL